MHIILNLCLQHFYDLVMNFLVFMDYFFMFRIEVIIKSKRVVFSVQTIGIKRYLSVFQWALLENLMVLDYWGVYCWKITSNHWYIACYMRTLHVLPFEWFSLSFNFVPFEKILSKRAYLALEAILSCMIIFSTKLAHNINLVVCIFKDQFFLNRVKFFIILLFLH